MLDLETGAIYDNVLERYLTFKEVAGVYFILSLYPETEDDVGECGELVSLLQIVSEHCLGYPLVRKNVEVFEELFSKDLQLLYKAAELLNYTRIDLGDAAIKVYALPRVPMVLALWSGEEGIPP